MSNSSCIHISPTTQMALLDTRMISIKSWVYGFNNRKQAFVKSLSNAKLLCLTSGWVTHRTSDKQHHVHMGKAWNFVEYRQVTRTRKVFQLQKFQIIRYCEIVPMGSKAWDVFFSISDMYVNVYSELLTGPL